MPESAPPRRPRPSPTPRAAGARPAPRPGPRPASGARPSPAVAVTAGGVAVETAAVGASCPELPPALGLRAPVVPGTAPARASAAFPTSAARILRAARRPSARGMSVAAIVLGTAVFVVASVTTPFAGADGTTRGAARQHARPDVVEQALAAVSSDPTTATSTSSSAAPSHSPAPTASARFAPVDHTVISGLAANGIPSVALNAYRVAAARMDHADPSCGVQWPLLAGIGREESDHGQFGGAVLHADGVSTPAIIGPALNGKAGNQYIPAPADGQALDGDAKYAHALGPMQFIPSTWAIYGIDADGDGHANIFDINDAALATARYLCAAGGDLSTRAGRVRAVFAYNHTDVYVAQVLALAYAYRTGTPISGLPHGNTSGTLPALGTSGPIPPANPGAPTANQKGRAAARKLARQRAEHKRLGGSTSPTTSAHGSPTPSRTKSHSPSPTHSPSHSPSPSGSPSPTSGSPSPSPSKTCMLMVCLP